MNSANKFSLGLISILMLSLIAILILWKSNLNLNSNQYILIGSFKNVSGLLKGADIRYRGYKIGTVNEIIPTPKDIKVHFSVQNGVLIPKGSNLTIKFDGIVGETYIFINPNESSKEYYLKNELLKGENYSDLSKFLDVGSKGLIQAETILIKLNELLESTNFSKKITNIINNLEYSSQQSKKIFKTLNDSELIINLNELIQNANNISVKLNETVSHFDTQTVESLKLQSESILNNLAVIVENTKGVLNKENTQHIKNILKNSDKISSNLESILNSENDKDPFGIKWLQSLNKLKLSSNTSIVQAQAESFAYYQADVKLRLNKNFLNIGFGDRFGKSKILQLQQGYQINEHISSRLGLYNQEVALGFDFFHKKYKFNLNLYDINDLKYSILSGYKINNFYIMLGGESNPLNSKQHNFLTGLSLSF